MAGLNGSMLGRLAVQFILTPALPLYAAVSVPDDSGHSISLSVPANRIVSLAPHATELLFAAGAGPRVVGVSEYSDYPPAARDLPRVSGGGGVDLEAVLALEPDLVIAWGSGNPNHQVDRLRALGVQVFLSEPRTIDDIAWSIERLGALAGTGVYAAEAATVFRTRADALQKQYAALPPVSVFYEVWPQPLLTINEDHLISKVIRLCGGRNIFDGLPTLTPQVDIEAVLVLDPEVIIAASDDGELPGWLEQWSKWPALTAVRNRNIRAIHADLIVRHTPRVLDGAEQLCNYLEQVRRQGSEIEP